MTLHVAAVVHRGRFELDVDLQVEPGEVLAVLGPNGSGKSTLLQAIAGLVPIDGGRISIDGLVVDDPATDVFVPLERRSVGVVFQDYLLFDHLDAIENVAFGLRARGVGKASARATARDWLARMGLADRAALRPAQLSGGQAQRVALARTLAVEPAVLLLDEPLAALDAGTRGEVRRDLRRHLAGFDGIRILVTHDPVDAYALADRVAILEAGRVVQVGTVAEVTAHPRSQYVADLMGINLIAGLVDEHVLTTATGVRIMVTGAPAGPSFAAIRPQAITVSRVRGDTSARNTWPVTVTDIDRLGERVRVSVAGAIALTAEISTAALGSLELAVGDEVFVSVKATDIRTYPT